MSSAIELQAKLLFSSTKDKRVFNKAEIVPEDAACQICHGPDQTHEPLVRDCNCRGLSGFVHVSCAIRAAEIKSNENINDWSECSKYWNLCSSCGELHQNKLAIDLLSQFVNYIEKKHPGDQFSINVINAHVQLLRAIADMHTRTSSIQCNRMGRQIAQGIISRIDEMKKHISTNSSTLPLIIISEVAAFNNLANISFAEYTKESVNEARKYYEMCQILCASIGKNENDIIMKFAKDGLDSVDCFLNDANATIPSDIMGKLNQLSITSNGSNREVELDDNSVKNTPKKRQKVESQKGINYSDASAVEVQSTMDDDIEVESNQEVEDDDVDMFESGNDVMLDDQGVSILQQSLTNYSHNTEDDIRRDDEVTVMEMDISEPTSQSLSDDCEHANEHDIESPPLEPEAERDMSEESSQQTLTNHLRYQLTILSKYNKSKTPENTAITTKSNKMIESFESSISNSINTLGLSTDELDSLKMITQLKIIDEANSTSLFSAIQTQYGTGAKINNHILPELKAESYDNVKRYKLSPFSDDSESTKEIQKILVSGLANEEPASSIIKAIRDGNEKHNWAAPKFSSRPILEQQSNENDTLAPIVATLARGSSGTDNCLTSQITKCTTTSYLLVKTGILPPHTELVQQVFAAYNIDRDELCDAQAVSSFISFLLKTPQEQLVYLSVNEILRIGLPPKDVVTLVLVFIKIHPNIKLLSASELGMSFLGVVIRNYQFYQGQKVVNQVMGGHRLPGGKRVVGPEHELTLDSEITIDNNEYQLVTISSNKTTTKKFASSLLPHLHAIEDRNETVFQIEQGIKLGSSHPKAESIGGDVLMIVDEVSTYHVTKDNLPLDQQPDNIDEVMDEKIATKLPISIGKKRYVIIYLRSTKEGQSNTVFKLAAEQFTLCYAAGVARKLINKHTELIIIFDNGKTRDGELNPGLATAFAYTCGGNVIAIICSTSIRTTSSRVLFKCLERTCTGCDTQLITAQHSSELAGVIMEYQYGRDVANKIRNNTFDTTSETLRGDLCDLLQSLSKYMSQCSRWLFSPSKSLFLDQLKHAIEQQRLSAEEEAPRSTYETGRRKSGTGRKDSTRLIDKALELMQTQKYVAMGHAKAILPALEEAGFVFTPGPGKRDYWPDNHNGNFKNRRDALNKRMKRAGLLKGKKEQEQEKLRRQLEEVQRLGKATDNEKRRQAADQPKVLPKKNEKITLKEEEKKRLEAAAKKKQLEQEEFS